MSPGVLQILSTVDVQSFIFVSVGLVASRQKSAIPSSSGKSLPTQRLPTVVPVVWANGFAVQAVVIVPVQSLDFVLVVASVSRQNVSRAIKSSVQSVSNGLSVQTPLIVAVQSAVFVGVILVASLQNASSAAWSGVQVISNALLMQASAIVAVQSADFVVVVLPVSRQNASRATGSAVQSPLNGLLVQRVVRAVLAGVKYLAKSALFAHAVSNGLVRHGTDLTADSQVDVAAASPARHSVIFISCRSQPRPCCIHRQTDQSCKSRPLSVIQ